MKKLILTTLSILLFAIPVSAADGMINIPSSFDVTETASRMKSILDEKGMTVFNHIKHSESAEKIGIELRDTELIIFGNPKVGSPLMKLLQLIYPKKH